MLVEEKLKVMGLELPEAPKPVGAYAPIVRVENLIFVSGQLPVLAGELKFRGKVGRDLRVEEGYEAAKVCALNALSQIKGEVGSLDKVKKLVKVAGYVNSEDKFVDHAKVIDGASELLFRLFGEKGRHARVAVGANSLPLDAAVQLEVIAEV